MAAMKFARLVLVSGVSLGALTTPALAQDTPAPVSVISAEDLEKTNDGLITVTGSRIKQDPTGARCRSRSSPTTRSAARHHDPEQLIAYPRPQRHGADNLASNSDVITGAQRGTNGLSAANLRGQGASRPWSCSTAAGSRRTACRARRST